MKTEVPPWRILREEGASVIVGVDVEPGSVMEIMATRRAWEGGAIPDIILRALSARESTQDQVRTSGG